MVEKTMDLPDLLPAHVDGIRGGCNDAQNYQTPSGAGVMLFPSIATQLVVVAVAIYTSHWSL